MAQPTGSRRSFFRFTVFKKTLIWLTLFIGCMLLMLPFGLRRVSEWQQQEQRLSPVFRLSPEQVTAINATGQGEHVVLTRTARGWKFTAPADARINTTAVQSFLDIVTNWVPVRKYKVLDPLSRKGEEGFGFRTGARKWS